jgi:hypothetical protein
MSRFSIFLAAFPFLLLTAACDWNWVLCEPHCGAKMFCQAGQCISTGGNMDAATLDAGIDIGSTVYVPAPGLDATTQQNDSSPTYPLGPYGYGKDDIISPLTFQGYADQAFLCKKATDMVQDTNTLREIGFKDIYAGAASCQVQKKQLMWLIVGSGWDGNSQNEVAAVQTQVDAGAILDGVLVVNVLVEDDNYQPVTASYGKLWANNAKFQLTFPVALDPSFYLHSYTEAFPTNILVDLETMKIVYLESGNNLSAVGQSMAEFFQGSNN